MNDEELIAVLEEVREPAKRCFEHYARQQMLGIFLDRPQPDLADIHKPVREALSEHPAFKAGRNIFFATKQLNLHPFYVAHGLLQVADATDARQALAWLYRIFNLNRVELRMVAAIYGLEVSEPRTLSNGVKLFPIATAPPSPNLRSIQLKHQIRPGGYMDMNIVIPPAIAVFEMGEIEATEMHETNKKISDDAFGRIADTGRAFTLSDSGAPVVGPSWTDFTDTSVALAEAGQMWMAARYEGSPSEHFGLKAEGEAVEWANRYLRMDRSSCRTLDVALDRLNLARRRRTAGDKAIDGGICLEALLGDKERQELSYKLRTRAALLLGATLEERAEIRETVRQFYSLRSRVVHGGRPEHGPDDNQAAAKELAICARAVRAAVERNGEFDFLTWLSGGPPALSEKPHSE